MAGGMARLARGSGKGWRCLARDGMGSGEGWQGVTDRMASAGEGLAGRSSLQAPLVRSNDTPVQTPYHPWPDPLAFYAVRIATRAHAPPGQTQKFACKLGCLRRLAFFVLRSDSTQ